jgi:hypothetical protein
VAIESATTAGFRGTVDAAANLRYDGATDGHVWHKVTVHNVDVQPVGALLHLLGAVMAQIGEVRAENRGGNDSWRGHDVCMYGGEESGGVIGEKLEGRRGYKEKK